VGESGASDKGEVVRESPLHRVVMVRNEPGDIVPMASRLRDANRIELARSPSVDEAV
jgi:hypothetical protein